MEQHGCWIDNGDRFICSQCGYECDDPKKLFCGPNVCPGCGSSGLRSEFENVEETKKKMIVYVIETSRTGYDNGILPVGYTSLEAAQNYIMNRDDEPVQITPMCYKATKFTPGLWKEYMYYDIHKIEVRDG